MKIHSRIYLNLKRVYQKAPTRNKEKPLKRAKWKKPMLTGKNSLQVMRLMMQSMNQRSLYRNWLRLNWKKSNRTKRMLNLIVNQVVTILMKLSLQKDLVQHSRMMMRINSSSPRYQSHISLQHVSSGMMYLKDKNLNSKPLH